MIDIEYTAGQAHAAAARGAAWLDQQCPGWEGRIDLDILNLADGELCMLGQTADCILGPDRLPDSHEYRGGFWRVSDAEGWTFGGNEQHELGFDIPPIPGYVRRETAYEMLGIAWREIIRERLAVPADAEALVAV